jgi:hypothetical protein
MVRVTAARTITAAGAAITLCSLLAVGCGRPLQDLTGLESVQSVTSWLQLNGNKVITSMRGLENLAYVQNLEMVENPQLTTLSALGSVMHLSSLTASRNPRLPTCEVRALYRRAGGQELSVDGNNNTATCP